MPLDKEARLRGAETKVKRTREAVIKAGVELMRENGMFGVGLSDISERSGVSPPTIYRHYGTVALLLSEIYDKFQRDDGLEYHI